MGYVGSGNTDGSYILPAFYQTWACFDTANASFWMSCNALLSFGLPASSGKAFVDKLWEAPIPNHDYWNGVLYMLGLLHVSGTFHLYY